MQASKPAVHVEGSSSMGIRVVMVEDHEMVRRAIVMLLSANGCEVVGEGATAEEGLRLLRHHRPQVALIDLSLPNGCGLGLIESAQREGLDIPSLVVSAYRDPGKMQLALQAGARGYISKMADFSELLQAVRIVAEGGNYFYFNSPSPQRIRPKLSQRQSQILDLVARGCTNLEIGERLHVSSGTVKRELALLCQMFDCTDRTSLVVKSRGLGEEF